jgi:hypothetical protein
MRDLGGLSAPVVVGVIFLVIIGAALAYILARRTGAGAGRAVERSEPLVEPALVADGVLALNHLWNEVRALRDAVRELRVAVQAKAVAPVEASPVFPVGRPLVVTVRGIANLEHLVQVEHSFERLDAVESVGIQTYRQGRGDFVMSLHQPLAVESIRSAIASSVSGPVSVDSVDVSQGRLELRIAE